MRSDGSRRPVTQYLAERLESRSLTSADLAAADWACPVDSSDNRSTSSNPLFSITVANDKHCFLGECFLNLPCLANIISNGRAPGTDREGPGGLVHNVLVGGVKQAEQKRDSTHTRELQQENNN